MHRSTGEAWKSQSRWYSRSGLRPLSCLMDVMPIRRKSCAIDLPTPGICSSSSFAAIPLAPFDRRR